MDPARLPHAPHPLALALVAVIIASLPILAVAQRGPGWYLMTPPVRERPELRSSAPLQEWHVIFSFDSARACEQARIDMANFIRTLQLDPSQMPAEIRARLARDAAAQRMRERLLTDSAFRRETEDSWDLSNCVSASDPRLSSGRGDADAGWILLAPPMVRGPGGVVLNVDAPRNEWTTVETYPTLEECKVQRDWLKETAKDPTRTEKRLVLDSLRLSECVSVTDRRLAPKP
jgi:hypothetical protein